MIAVHLCSVRSILHTMCTPTFVIDIAATVVAIIIIIIIIVSILT